MIPVTLVNGLVSRPHEFILTTWQGGANFYLGNGPEATGSYNALNFVTASPLHEAADFSAEARRRTGRHLSPREISRFWYIEGLRQWRAAPIPSLRLGLQKLGLVFNNLEIGDSSDAEFVSIAAAPALSFAWFRFGVFLPLAALSLGCVQRSPFRTFGTLVVLVGLISTAAFFVVGRYRVPWAPALILLAACGFTDLVFLLRNRQWNSLAWRSGLLVLPATILAWWPQTAFASTRWSHSEIYLALACTEAGQVQEAIDALDDARAIGPEGSAQVDEQLRSSFVQHLTKALARPLSAARAVERARLLRQLPQGRKEARRLIDAALEVNPHDPVALRESGAWWLGESANPSSRQRTMAQLRQAALGQPGDLPATLLLALLEADASLLQLPAVRNAGPPSVRLRLVRRILMERGEDGRESRRSADLRP